MNIQVKVAIEKREHPERFCTNPRCLWRVVTSRGPNPCRKHPVTAACPQCGGWGYYATGPTDAPIQTQCDCREVK